jgi:hypothetical protein
VAVPAATITQPHAVIGFRYRSIEPGFLSWPPTGVLGRSAKAVEPDRCKTDILPLVERHVAD